MRFGEALILLGSGMLVARPKWRKAGGYLSVERRGLTKPPIILSYFRGRGVRSWTPSYEDMFALDWVEVERSHYQQPLKSPTIIERKPNGKAD